MGLRVVLAQGERIEQALRRLRKLLERHGALWDLQRRRYFIKPTEVRRAKQFKKKFKARRETLLAKKAGEQPTTSLSDPARTFWKRTGKS
jgi:ribosomal protein S21